MRTDINFKKLSRQRPDFAVQRYIEGKLLFRNFPTKIDYFASIPKMRELRNRKELQEKFINLANAFLIEKTLIGGLNYIKTNAKIYLKF